MNISELLKLLEANPVVLLLAALPLSLFALIRLINFLMRDKEDDSVQTLVQAKLIEFASKSIETTDLLRKAYEENSKLQARHIELQSRYNEQINVASTILARIAQRLDEHDNQVEDRIKGLSQPILDAVREVNSNLFKNATTKVVIRSSGKVVSTFIAHPHQLPSGENVVVIDLLKKE